MSIDEQELLILWERCATAWEAGGVPARHDLSRFLHLVPRVLEDLVRTRSQLHAARAEAGTLPLLLSSTSTD